MTDKPKADKPKADKAKKPVRAKVLPVEIGDDGKPRVVLDTPQEAKLAAAICLCVQIQIGEVGNSRAKHAQVATAALQQVLGIHSPKAPDNDAPKA